MAVWRGGAWFLGPDVIKCDAQRFEWAWVRVSWSEAFGILAQGKEGMYPLSHLLPALKVVKETVGYMTKHFTAHNS